MKLGSTTINVPHGANMNGRVYPADLFHRELERCVRGRSRSIVFNITPKVGDLILVRDVRLNVEFSAIFIDQEHLMTSKGIVGTYLIKHQKGEDLTDSLEMIAFRIVSEVQDAGDP